MRDTFLTYITLNIYPFKATLTIKFSDNFQLSTKLHTFLLGNLVEYIYVSDLQEVWLCYLVLKEWEFGSVSITMVF